MLNLINTIKKSKQSLLGDENIILVIFYIAILNELKYPS